MSTVYFHRVTTRCLGTPGTIGKGLHDGVDVLFGQHLMFGHANAEKDLQLGVQHAVQKIALVGLGRRRAPLRAARYRIVDRI